MPVTFARLRIAGFKSFAEPVSLEILPGLTGIVGPNGCGKSNVVEALRWCMGEGSARSLRGTEMDDLVFAGTVGRPARNLAEVVLTLEDASGLAPPPLHEQAELQIGRRLERGAGSAYRINGREVLARDVQTLFADLGSGARSSAMISQGRVAAIVGARPEERRGVLEEAAGITGLHSRRHEAELKLRATETNLARAEDLRSQLEAQADSLATQAERATRYRSLADGLRAAEATLVGLLHARAGRAVENTRAARIETARVRATAELAIGDALAAERAAEAALPAPRAADALARTLLERRRIERDGAARDSDRARGESEAAERRLAQALLDREAAAARQVDAERERSRLMREQGELDAAAAALPERRHAAENGLRDAAAAIDAAERASRQDAALAAAAATRRAEHERDRQAAAERLARADALLHEIGTGRQRAEAELPDPALLPGLDAALAEARAALDAAEQALDAATGRRSDASRLADATRLAAEDAVRRHRAATETEAEAAGRAARLDGDAGTTRLRLAEAERGLVADADRARLRDGVEGAEQKLAAAAAALQQAEATRSVAAAARLEAEARVRDGARTRAQLEADARRADVAHARATAECQRLIRDHEAARAAGPPDGALDRAVAARMAAEAALDANGAALAAADGTHASAQAEQDERAGAVAALRDAASRLAAEAEGLAQALAAGPEAGGAEPTGREAAGWSPVGASLEVPPALEIAVAALLAEGLEAGSVDEAPQTWRSLPPLAPENLPPGATSLSALLGTAPASLGRALERAGLIEREADGNALQEMLRPGQCLVTRDGALWRWDGYRSAAARPGPALIRLRQRARHREALVRLAEANAAIEPATATLQRAQARRDAAAGALLALRRDRDAAGQALEQARGTESGFALADARNRALRQSLAPLRARAETILAEAEAARAGTAALLAALTPRERLHADAAAAARTEHAAAETEQTRRRARIEADAFLQNARAAQAALQSRHATHDTERRALVPVLARLGDEASTAGAALSRARQALAASDPRHAVGAAEAAGATAKTAEETERSARTARDEARASLSERHARRERVVAACRDAENRIGAFDARRGAATAEQEEARAAASALQAAAVSLPDAAAAAATAARSEATLAAAREEERVLSRSRAAIAAEEAALAARRQPVETALLDWTARLGAAQAATEEADRRLAEAGREADRRRIDPDREAARLGAIEAALRDAEAGQAAAALGLDAAEQAARRAQSGRRDADAALAAGREAALRAEAREEQAREIMARLLVEHPEPPATAPADLGDAAEASLRRRIAGLARERDSMGPVNLRADLELAECRARIDGINREHGEIETAIGRLRGQIGQMNREGRERLLAVFERVDRNFQALFARMFDGGRAHLGMVGSDDPLQAGIEIYAQPPGKKLATLSLLSGGEQALTALSLVFAVFRCNTAPICVLDEVDAPLDDSNVERFCALLGDMAREAGTRFLVVTHHQLTMAHMDRLYGVTMQERGVSRVLSVDLAAATSMTGPA